MAALSIGFFIFFAGIVVSSFSGKESIEVLDQTIIWTDKKGNVRVRCTFADIEAKSFERFTRGPMPILIKGTLPQDRERLTAGMNRTFVYRYRVSTTQGKLEWNRNISYCKHLNFVISKAANRC